MKKSLNFGGGRLLSAGVGVMVLTVEGACWGPDKVRYSLVVFGNEEVSDPLRGESP